MGLFSIFCVQALRCPAEAASREWTCRAAMTAIHCLHAPSLVICRPSRGPMNRRGGGHMKKKITGGPAFLALLKEEGGTPLFGNPGTPELPIMHGLKAHPDLT